MPADMLIPSLPPNACLGLIAPAGPPREGTLALVAPMMERLGFRAKIFPGCHGPTHLDHLAASDGQRLADLHAAFADPEVDAVVALRGGYGCMRLLDRVDTALLRRHPKPLVGYSDLTALHALRQTLGLPGWHAPMPASDWHLGEAAWADAQALAHWLRAGLKADDVIRPVPGVPAADATPAHGATMAPHPLDQGQGLVRGRLTGGNLAVLVALLGTPFMPDLDGAILFLEDVAEDPYKVDRLLCQLRLSGRLERVAGFLIGSFSDADSPDAVLADVLRPLGKPVLAGWPSGHCCPNVALPLGVEVEMDLAQRCLRVVG